MLLLTVLLDSVQKTWTSSESRISQFREARVAFDLVTKSLSQASLNTYWDLIDEDDDGLVDEYFKTSELHFVTMEAKELAGAGTQEPVGHAVFFQAPLGFSTNFRNLSNLYNGRGYFVAYGSDKKFRPSFVGSQEKYRYRLMEFRPPAESNQVFADGDEERQQNQRQDFTQWFKQSMTIGEGSFESHLNPLAENIVTLVISPRDTLPSGSSRDEMFSSIAPNYSYDSNDDSAGFKVFSQQVPPLVRVTMVAVDETTMIRKGDNREAPPAVIDQTLNRLFKRTRDYEDDIAELEQEFQKEGVNYKVFSSMVMLRSAKWSGERSPLEPEI